MYTLPRIDFCVGCKGFLPVSKKGEAREFYCSNCEPVKQATEEKPKVKSKVKTKIKKSPGVTTYKRKSRAKNPRIKKLFTPVQEKILEIMSTDTITLSEIQERVKHYSPFYVHNNLKTLVKRGTINRKMVGVSRPFAVYSTVEINLDEYHKNTCEKMLEKIFSDTKVFTFEELYCLLENEFSEKVIRNNICSLQKKGKIFTRKVNDPNNISIYCSSKENLFADKRLLIKDKIYNFLVNKDFATNKEIRTAMCVGEYTIRNQIKNNPESFTKWMTPGDKPICLYSIKEKDELIAKSHPHLTKIK